MKGGLGDAALAKPEIAFTGDETIAQKGAHCLISPGLLDVISVVLNQHMLDMVGVGQQQSLLMQKAESNDITVVAGSRHEGVHHIPREVVEVAFDQGSLRLWDIAEGAGGFGGLGHIDLRWGWENFSWWEMKSKGNRQAPQEYLLVNQVHSQRAKFAEDTEGKEGGI